MGKRPPTRSKVIRFLVTSRERRLLAQVARRNAITLSDFVRAMALTAARALSADGGPLEKGEQGGSLPR